MTYRELVYMCLDEIKLASDDSYITEDHILFLISKYRAFLLKQKYEKTNMPVADSNYQYLSMDSTSKIPVIMNIAKPEVNLTIRHNVGVIPVNETKECTYVSNHRLSYVGNNRFLKSIAYCTRNPNNGRLVTKGVSAPLDSYTILAVFEDILEASEYTLENQNDILDKVCPIEADLIPGVQELVVKDILGIAYRPQDKANNASDDLGSVGLVSGNPRNNK